MMMNDITSLAIACMDLTSLGDHDSEQAILHLCEMAQTQQGHVAAVCVFPQFVTFARNHLPNDIRIATVINFPHGELNLASTLQQIASALSDNADELDVVLPFTTLKQGDVDAVNQFLHAVREHSQDHTLKIIIESGALNEIEIKKACELVIESKANFIKTSTGKIEQGATLPATQLILNAIRSSHAPIGLKVSGGVRTKAQAHDYITQAQSIMGTNWVTPAHFRIGASSLLNALLP